MKRLMFYLLIFTLGLVSVKILNLIYEEQKTPYIDEIFHIPQAQLYCNDYWLEWNPKITTLPGLYLVSYVILKPVKLLLHYDFCTVFYLRGINIIATLLNFVLAFGIIGTLDKKYKVKSPNYFQLLSALNIAIFPPLYFFTFLYYTDPWSTTFVLLAYYLHLLQMNFSKFLVTLVSFMAILMRQTNVIWIGMLILDKAWERISKNVKTYSIQDVKSTIKVFQWFFSLLRLEKRKIWKLINLIFDVFGETYHLIFVCICFALFVFWNGSIVVGDKTAHTPKFHLMQNLYFLNFAAFFGLPFLLSEVLPIIKKPPNLFLSVLLMGLTAVLSEANKMEHPYLLADNRHLAFYIWKRLFGHQLYRRLIIPTYVFSGLLFYRLMQKKAHFMFAVILSTCIIINLTPQYLFELRYFLIPYIMWRLQFKKHSVVILETIFYTATNIFVIYLFLNKPFSWISEPGMNQRFIW